MKKPKEKLILLVGEERAEKIIEVVKEMLQETEKNTTEKETKVAAS